MNDPAITVGSVDALHAHFAEWVKFLDDKQAELEAQLAKLEARKNRGSPPEPAPAPPGTSYLELAFGPEGPAAATNEETELNHPAENEGQAGALNEAAGTDVSETPDSGSRPGAAQRDDPPLDENGCIA